MRLPLRNDDEGFSLLLVMGFTGIVLAMVMLGANIAYQSLTSSRQHVNFETALSVAESGVDDGLARAQSAYVNHASTYAYPAPSGTFSFDTSTCNLASVAWPYSGVPTAAQERSWARTQLDTIATTPACRVHLRQGDYVMMVPSGHQTVYAMSYVPSYGATKVTRRLLKSEYLFQPYRPTDAVLTGGSLEIDSSTVVKGVNAAANGLASIHTNGQLTVAGGNPTVTGPVSMSVANGTQQSNNFASNPSGLATVTAPESIPHIRALNTYNQNYAALASQWFDLCRDGKVRQPAGTGPCTGTVICDYGSTGACAGQIFNNGWTFSATLDQWGAPLWTATGAFNDGVYYIDGADATDGVGNPTVNSATIIAASQNQTCNKVGGNITWNHTNITNPKINNLFLQADQDILMTSNISMGSPSASGLFVAGDQINMQTSSNGVYGAVIAQDACDPAPGLSPVDSDIVKNPTITFDPSAMAPFTSTINSTLWLEYPD